MKKLFLSLLSIALLTVSCEEKESPFFDGNARTYITGKETIALTQTRAAGALSIREVVENTEAFVMVNPNDPTQFQASYGVTDDMRDPNNNRFVIPTDWAIFQGVVTDQILGMREYICMDNFFTTRDTIAYIPNRVMEELQRSITAAYNSQNYSECYRLLEEGFVFTPTTGAEYRALKEQGLN